MNREVRRRLPVLAAALWAALVAGAARADDYDNALECLILIEMAKADYTAANVDALRDAGNKMVEWTNLSRPKDLTDKQKLDRYYGTIERLQKSGGMKNPENRELAVFCADMYGIKLVLPQPK